ncbi:MAG: amidohydrolase [Ruminococcaceae bacterium]|nr:amidohydrolase [Oscillospiraceae bacterium]
MEQLKNAVQKHRDLILGAERYIWQNPETGYRETKTNAYLAKEFERLGYTLTYADGITGFYTVIDTGREGPEVLVLGELDSVICPTHPEADAETGAVHSCGHHAQCAALLGLAAALKEPHVLDGLSGRIRLCAVPAEELLEIEYRKELRAKGKIKYFGGKPEFLHRGYFDGVDMAFMIHTAQDFQVTDGSIGCIAKNIIYRGKSAHAGGAPWQGVNALYAASCGINAANAVRETFKEADVIRFHPIVTHGGDMVNAVPAEVRLESYVRGKTFEAIVNANKKLNRALAGAALSLGANVEIIDIPGYGPLVNDPGMMEMALDAMNAVMPEKELKIQHTTSSGCTDMGDLSSIMPVVHPYAGGATGTGHGADYLITDPDAATVVSAQVQLVMLHLLLKDGAARAKKILADFTPLFASKEEYLAFVDTLDADGERIVYGENSAEVKL